MIFTGSSDLEVRWFDPHAPTPKSAWTKISPWDGVLGHAYHGVCRVSENEIFIRSNTVGNAYIVNVLTGVRRNRTSSDPLPLSFGNAPAAPRQGSSYSWTKRNETTGMVFWALSDPYGSFPPKLKRFNPQNGSTVTSSGLPAWIWDVWGGSYISYAVTDDNKAVGWPGERRVWCWDSDEHVMREFTATAPVQPIYPDEGGTNGINGKWAWVKATTPSCFVGINSSIQNAWVFRPPAVWRIA
jgi:hypothetical protein